MIGYVIDPQAKVIRQVDYDGHYKSIYGFIDAGTFDVVRLNDKGDVVYIDDEGLLNDPEWFFTVEGYGQALAGKGLVLGSDVEGESQAPTLTLDELTAMVGWRRLKVEGWDKIDQVVDHPVFGRVPMVGQRVVLGKRDGGGE